MRKKSLRAMTSAVFEAPESRAEAILQNILGANNVLVPPEAPFEEILQAILYNTPYTKEAETRIEKILLAIKNNGTYDEEAQSRDEEILISKLNETAYTKDAESRIEELLILWAAQSVIKQLEGVPPLTFTAQGQPLINWIINGASGGVGDKTANLFDYKTAYSSYISDNDIVISPSDMISSKNYFTSEEIGETITISAYAKNITSNRVYIAANINGVVYTGQSINAGNQGTINLTVTPTSTNDYFVLSYGSGGTYNTFNNMMLVKGSTVPSEYIPFGYKIPILCGGETNTIYPDTPLYDGDSISMADTGIEIPTINGQNTLAVDTTVQPEKVYIEYK